MDAVRSPRRAINVSINPYAKPGGKRLRETVWRVRPLHHPSPQEACEARECGPSKQALDGFVGGSAACGRADAAKRCPSEQASHRICAHIRKDDAQELFESWEPEAKARWRGRGPVQDGTHRGPHVAGKIDLWKPRRKPGAHAHKKWKLRHDRFAPDVAPESTQSDPKARQVSGIEDPEERRRNLRDARILHPHDEEPHHHPDGGQREHQLVEMRIERGREV
eukprot:scaffold3_cov273-Pinguiococcus_pyrenoidosus.AAC.20